MYRVRHWNHDRDEMTEEFVEALEDEVLPVLTADPGGVRRFAP